MKAVCAGTRLHSNHCEHHSTWGFTVWLFDGLFLESFTIVYLKKKRE
jgi:hypothetical protein